jgi:hypothetical protein
VPDERSRVPESLECRAGASAHCSAAEGSTANGAWMGSFLDHYGYRLPVLYRTDKWLGGGSKADDDDDEEKL